MTYQLRSTSDYAKLTLDVAIILLGVLILIGFIDFPQTNFWLPWLLALAGVLLATLPHSVTSNVGLVIALIGVYLILRSSNVIETPILRYCLGGFLVVAGGVNLILSAKGGSAPFSTT